MRQIYWSPTSRVRQEKRDQARDVERGGRLGENQAHPTTRHTPARARRQVETVDPLAPANPRLPALPATGTIVALLATPEAAWPTITRPGGEVIALCRA